MGMVKVWNISDGEHSSQAGHNRMVLGKSLKPGQAVLVDEARLARAHKVHSDVEGKLLHVGARPPEWYSSKKKPPRAQLDARVIDEKGQPKGRRPVVPGRSHGPVVQEVVLSDEVKLSEDTSVMVEAPAPAEEESSDSEEDVQEEVEESSDSQESNRSSRRRRRR